MPPKKVKITGVQAERLAKLTFLIAKVCQDREQYFDKLHNLTSAEFRLLRFMKDKTAINAKELASYIGVTQGRVTQVLTTLEEKGYLVRDMDLEDRRNIRIDLTESAKHFIQAVTKKHSELNSKVLDKIPEEIRDTVIEAIEEVLLTFSSWNKEKGKED